jgi:hypothetical protein
MWNPNHEFYSTTKQSTLTVFLLTGKSGMSKIGDSKHNNLHMHIIKRRETLHA